MVRAMCGVQFKNRRSKIFMFMLGLVETTDQLAVTNSVHCYRHVLIREVAYVLRWAFDFEVEREKWRLKRTWKKQVEEEYVKVGLRLPIKVEC